MGNPRGVIITEHFPTCGKCLEGFVDYRAWPETKSQLVSGLRKHGWKYTKGHGWVCPECIAHKEEN